MKVHCPKLYNMAHLLALNVLLLPKDLTIIFISDEWLSKYGLLENFNASVTRMGTGKVTGTWTTGSTTIALCTSCSRAKMIQGSDRAARWPSRLRVRNYTIYLVVHLSL